MVVVYRIPMSVLAVAMLLAGVAVAAEDLSIADLIEHAEPSCVRLDVTGRAGRAIGSGFIVARPNWVVTNLHVVAGATKATASFADGTTCEVEGFLAYGEKRDVVVLQIKSDRASKPLALAPALPRKGEQVVAIGAPKGLSFTATEGIISAIRKGEELKEFGHDARGTWLQTSTPISGGSSGGPLFNMQGQVLGANSGSLASGQNLNFAISSDDIGYVLKAAARGKLNPLSMLGPAPKPSTQPIPTDSEQIVCKLPASRRFTHRFSVAKETDEFDKATWLRTPWIPLKHNDPRLTSCGLRISVPFREDGPSPGVIWELGTTARAFAFIGPNARRFQLLVDGESIQLRDPEHKGDVGRGGVSERMTTVLTIEGFLELIMAKEVKARVGNLQYQLANDHLECLRDLASQIPEGVTDEGRVKVERYELKDDPSLPPALAARLRKKKDSVGAEQAFRTWTSADGAFKVQAKLVRREDESVVLHRKDIDQQVTVPLASLSEADRQFVEKQE